MSTFEVVEGWLDGAASAGPLPDVADVAVGPDDTVYLLARGPGRIVVMSPSGEMIRLIGAGSLSTRPHGLEVDAERHHLLRRRAAPCCRVIRPQAASSADGSALSMSPSPTGVDPDAGDLATRLRSITAVCRTVQPTDPCRCQPRTVNCLSQTGTATRPCIV